MEENNLKRRSSIRFLLVTVVTVIISCCLGVIIFRDTLGAMTMADIKNDFSWEIADLAMLTDIRDDPVGNAETKKAHRIKDDITVDYALWYVGSFAGYDGVESITVMDMETGEARSTDSDFDTRLIRSMEADSYRIEGDCFYACFESGGYRMLICDSRAFDWGSVWGFVRAIILCLAASVAVLAGASALLLRKGFAEDRSRTVLTALLCAALVAVSSYMALYGYRTYERARDEIAVCIYDTFDECAREYRETDSLREFLGDGDSLGEYIRERYTGYGTEIVSDITWEGDILDGGIPASEKVDIAWNENAYVNIFLKFILQAVLLAMLAPVITAEYRAYDEDAEKRKQGSRTSETRLFVLILFVAVNLYASVEIMRLRELAVGEFGDRSDIIIGTVSTVQLVVSFIAVTLSGSIYKMLGSVKRLTAIALSLAAGFWVRWVSLKNRWSSFILCLPSCRILCVLRSGTSRCLSI